MTEPDAHVAVVGSINVDHVVRLPRLPGPGETVTGGSLVRRQGGKGANQAVAAARFGARVSFVGAVGDDPAGRAAVSALTGEGIDVAGVTVVPTACTGLATVLVDDRGNNQIAVASGANHELTSAHVAEALARTRLREGDVVLLSFEILDAPLVAAARRARRSGARVLVNPAPARSLASDLLELSPVLTPNAIEVLELDRPVAAATDGLGDDRVADAARRLSTLTGQPIVVTLGADGALVVLAGDVIHLVALDVTPLDTTGAGDAFSGVLAASLAAGQQFLEAVRLAGTAASLSVQVAGARAALPARPEVEAALAAVARGPT